MALVRVGCVPIRQYIGGSGLAPSPSSSFSSKDSGAKTEFENPDDFKNAGNDAWKDEMEGIASWYGEDFNGRLTANGEVYEKNKLTPTHKTRPCGTVVQVTNQRNG